MDRRLDRQANALRAGAAAAMRCALAMLAAAACADKDGDSLPACNPAVAGFKALTAEQCYLACVGDARFHSSLRAWPVRATERLNIAPECGTNNACLCGKFIEAGGHCQSCGDGKLSADIWSSGISSVEVISAFAARVDAATGTTTRVCGAPLTDDAGQLLPGEAAIAPNGIELTAAFLAKYEARAPGRCNPERNLGVAEGDFVHGTPLRAQSQWPTLQPSQVKLTQLCVQPQQTSPVDAPCSATLSDVTADVVRYRKEADPCTDGRDDTFQNVAIVVDHSGSVQGLVATDEQKCAVATRFAEDLPNKIKQTDFGNCASDPQFLLAGGAAQFIDALNDPDRVVTLGFDETSQVFPGCADYVACLDEAGAPAWACGGNQCACLHDSDCAKHGPGLHCGAYFYQSLDHLGGIPLYEGLKWCYGSSDTKKLRNKYGIDFKARLGANGRAPVYEALGAAYDLLRGTPPGPPDATKGGNAKHIVLLTDGPDTCVPSDNFLFTTFAGPSGPAGQCRSECKFTTLHGYRELLLKMAHDQFPIHVHVIQIQSKGHLAPDPAYQELACRSQGTYQFINTEDFPRPDPNGGTPSDPTMGNRQAQFLYAVSRAVSNVRNTLAGSWRIGFQHAAFGPGNAPKGVQLALRGRITIADPQLPSLSLATEVTPVNGARFDQPIGWIDTRPPYRLACASHADCGGTGDECAAHACTDTGLCRPTPAPDLRPCGPAGKGVCCQGQCAASCDGVCK